MGHERHGSNKGRESCGAGLRGTLRRPGRIVGLWLVSTMVMAAVTAWALAAGMPSPIHAQGADVPSGRELYVKQCQGCHGDQGQGRYGPGLVAVLSSVDPPRYAGATIERGVPGTTMPAWASSRGGPLAGDEVDALSTYVVALVRQRPALSPQLRRELVADPGGRLLGHAPIVAR
jgi:mono/diheme cytochrome c family protein